MTTTESSSSSIGIIYPPPELRNIVDKTAGFVANSKNGPEFEARIRDNEAKNPKFGFLTPGDPYHAYYVNKVKELRQLKEQGEDITVRPVTEVKEVSSSQGNLFKLPLTPVPAFEFSADPPSLQAMELDVVKLTAQFVAIHGRSFLNNLMAREHKNYLFDFVRPQHGLFNYFSLLTEQYVKILKASESESMASSLRQEVSHEKLILDRVKDRLQHTLHLQAEKKRSVEEAEKERLQYSSIDWHDFVVVETVDYQPHETGLFPPPTTPEMVGSRILLMQRMEEQGVEDEEEMELEREEEEGEKKDSDTSNSQVFATPSLSNASIRKDYDPRKRDTSSSSNSFLVSPITGHTIPADKLADHMRYGLLDPKWIQERERSVTDTSPESVFAPGASIDSSLRQLAERRTDIFGEEETLIGSRVDEGRNKDKVVWDGYSSSAHKTIIEAQSQITIQDQIQDMKQRREREEEKEKIGPKKDIQERHSRDMLKNQSQMRHMLPPMHSLMPQSLLPAPNPFILPNPSMNPTMNPAMNFSLNPSMNAFPSFPPLSSLPVPSLPIPSLPVNPVADLPEDPSGDPEASAAKRLKTEESLIPEQDFLQSSPSVINIRVSVPSVTEKEEWNLRGQTLSLSLEVKESVSSVKTKIHEMTGMPVGKQKLQLQGIFLKDTNSLAFYNMTNATTLVLQVKERGGRKK